MAVTQTITAITEFPQQGDSQFDVKADAFVRQLATQTVSQLNTAFSQINTTETNINTKESNAAASATAAATSASNAATSAANAATSATNAANSASAAAASATAAANSYDAFDDRWLGAKSANPTTDNDGNALQVGAVYWNTQANELRIWTGSAWQTQSATSQYGGIGFKNYIINGGLQVWQRGDSFNISTNVASYTADRFVVAFEQNSAGTVTHQTDVLVPGLGIVNTLKMSFTAAMTIGDGAHIRQKIENIYQKYMRGKTFTLSYYARANRNMNIYSHVFYVDGVTLSNNYKQLTTSWQRYSCKLIFDNTLDQDHLHLQVIRLAEIANAGDWIEVTGIQLEEGTVATPFEVRPYSLELMMCQRYYIRLNSTENAWSRYGHGLCVVTTTNAWCLLYTKVKMRTIPTVSYSGSIALVDGSNIYPITNLTAAAHTSDIVTLNVTVASGLTIGRPVQLTSNGNTTSYIELNAEL